MPLIDSCSQRETSTSRIVHDNVCFPNLAVTPFCFQSHFPCSRDFDTRRSFGQISSDSTDLVDVMLGEITRDAMRRYRRYRIVADVFCCWTSNENRFESIQGITRDVSTAGAYVFSNFSPEVGMQVQLNILWPDFGFTNPRGHLAGTGTVLRVDAFRDASPSKRVGFALSLQFHPAPDESLFDHWARFFHVVPSGDPNPATPRCCHA
jgi:PilZ domain